MAYDFKEVKAKADNGCVRSQVILARMLWLGLPEQNIATDHDQAKNYLEHAVKNHLDHEAIQLLSRINRTNPSKKTIPLIGKLVRG